MAAAMDLLTPVIERLRRMTEAQVAQLSAATGVPAPTIAKIKYGQTPNPRVLTVQALYQHLFETQEQATA